MGNVSAFQSTMAQSTPQQRPHGGSFNVGVQAGNSVSCGRGPPGHSTAGGHLARQCGGSQLSARLGDATKGYHTGPSPQMQADDIHADQPRQEFGLDGTVGA